MLGSSSYFLMFQVLRHEIGGKYGQDQVQRRLNIYTS